MVKMISRLALALQGILDGQPVAGRANVIESNSVYDAIEKSFSELPLFGLFDSQEDRVRAYVLLSSIRPPTSEDGVLLNEMLKKIGCEDVEVSIDFTRDNLRFIRRSLKGIENYAMKRRAVRDISELFQTLGVSDD